MEKELLYPELTYKIRGLCMKVYNELGYGLKEKDYEIALRSELIENKMQFSEQLYAPVFYSGKKLRKKYLDFLVENKVVVELKVGLHVTKSDFDQVKGYLKNNNISLGLLVLFTPTEVKFYRSILTI